MNKTFCKWEEMLMEYILSCSRQGSNSTTMEAINQSDDDMTTFAIFVMAIFTSCFDGTFIRLCTRVRKNTFFIPVLRTVVLPIQFVAKNSINLKCGSTHEIVLSPPLSIHRHRHQKLLRRYQIQDRCTLYHIHPIKRAFTFSKHTLNRCHTYWLYILYLVVQNRLYYSLHPPNVRSCRRLSI